MRSLLEAMVMAAERGAHIARACRQYCTEHTALEKSGDEANPRFTRDFKTLADVLVQESIRRDLLKKFPALEDNILGEESNTFTNLRGESVSIELHDKESKTEKLLATLVHARTAKELARAVHTRVVSPDLTKLPSGSPKLDMSDVGIWIDPIDGTNEYIQGQWGEGPGGVCDMMHGRTLHGLPCVTVLVGAFLRSTGDPIVGVINQPFYTRQASRYVWGVCHEGVRASSIGEPAPANGALVVSGSENTIVCYRLMTSGYTLTHPGGAGLKLLMVALGEADGYILSRDSSYRWDTCGAHAVLRALGGDLLTFAPPHVPLHYNQDAENRNEEGVQRFANRGGVIAFRHADTLDKLKMALY